MMMTCLVSTTPYMEQRSAKQCIIPSPPPTVCMKNRARDWTDPICLGKISSKTNSICPKDRQTVKVIFTLVQSVIITDLHK